MSNVTKSPYRALPVERRVSIFTRLFATRKDARAHYIQRLAGRGGFRAVTLLAWPAEKLARELVRLNAQTADDEADLLQALYVDLEPAVQETFLDAAKVPHKAGVIEETLQPPFADAATVSRAATTVRDRHGEDGTHYLRTVARYNAGAWPGIADLVAALPAD